MGWQGRDPSTNFRGAGFISLENLLFFAKTFSTSFQSLLKKQGRKGAVWEYPFAAAGVNITFMIMQMLDLDATKPMTFLRTVFLQMLSENEWAFDLLYCVAFVVMDKQWLDRNATYMEFNVQDCYELSAEYEGEYSPQKLEELGNMLTGLGAGDSVVIAKSFLLCLANLAEEVQFVY